MGEESSATLVENRAAPNPAMEYKKSTKPIMEKRRRARINASLLELKALLLDVMRQEGVRHQKMEKADILEMAVKHLRQIQKGVGLSTDRFFLNKYNAGFNECANEVSRYLNDTDNVDIDMRTKILDHLMNVVQGGDNDDVTQLPGPALSPVASSVQSSPPCSTSPISLPASPVKITGNLIQTVNSLATTTPVLGNGQMAAVPQMQVIVRQGASPTVVQYTAPSTTVIPTLNAPSQVFGGLQLIPVQLANGDVVFAIPKQPVQQQVPSSPDKQTEADESPAKEQNGAFSPSQVSPPLHRNQSPPNQHPTTHQHNPPSNQHHIPTSQHHSPSGHHHNTSPHQSPAHQYQQLQPHQTPSPVLRPTAHQSVIRHTSPKMQCVDQNNNDFRAPSHYSDNLFKKESEIIGTDNFPQKQEKQDLGRYQSFIDYHRKMETLNCNTESNHQPRNIQKKLSSTHHGLVYKTVRESRFQPYTQHHYSQDIGQQCMWRPW